MVNTTKKGQFFCNFGANMYIPLNCIALRTVHHSDSRSILTAWSRERGRVSLSMPDGAGREARRRRALTMPLGLFEVVADERPGREIFGTRDLRALPGSPAAASPGPAKAMLCLFLADFLDRLLRTSAPDPLLSDFLFESLRALGQASRPAAIANFHIVFLFRLSRFLGIGPDMSLPAGARPAAMIFDMREGRFRTSIPAHPLFYAGEDSAAAKLLSRMSYSNMHRVRMERSQRARLLDAVIEYYGIHLSTPGVIQSLEVLRQLS